MSMNPNDNPRQEPINPTVFFAVFLAITLVLVGTSWWVLTYVREQTRVADVERIDDEQSAIYVNFSTNNDEYVSAESYLAMGNYVRDRELDNGETLNVQVLTDLSANEITTYMLYHFVSGMRVNCTYCHTLDNFAADVWEDSPDLEYPAEEAMANKALAREHLRMTQDLNRNWLVQLPALSDQKKPSGAQITCATCHNGQAQPVTWEGGISGLPDSFRLPLEHPVYLNEQDYLNVNARTDVSLDRVQYNQYVMYHMNVSMNVGCTHCHNSRYFPSNEVPAKAYSLNMLQMTQYIWAEYGWTMNGKQPSCTMCHQERIIPGGAARSADVVADSQTVLAPGEVDAPADMPEGAIYDEDVEALIGAPQQFNGGFDALYGEDFLANAPRDPSYYTGVEAVAEDMTDTAEDAAEDVTEEAVEQGSEEAEGAEAGADEATDEADETETE